jgi:hypothetical protein
MDRVLGSATPRQRLLVVGTVLATALAAIVPFAAGAGAADTVNLSTALNDQVTGPVTDSPIQIGVGVVNSGTATATGVVSDLSIPGGATVIAHSDNCTTAATKVSCTYAPIAPGANDGANVWFSFATTGTRTVTSTAHADQPDADGNSSDHVDIAVGNESADLAAEPPTDTERVVVGTEATFSVSHVFANKGPTAAGDATVTGTITGGATIVPGSFNFAEDFFGPLTNEADDDCTLTSTTFTCNPLFSAGIFDAAQPFVFYNVKLPTTPSTVVASATITGRADTNHANDTSKVEIDVDTPKAEIFAQLPPNLDPVASSTPFLLQGPVINSGDIAAHDLVAVMTPPDGWAIALPADPPPAGVSCTIVASPLAMRCTRATLPTLENWSVDARLTPPAGFGTGTVSLSVTTTTPEIGVYPNSATTNIRFAPNGQTRVLAITPNANLADGNSVVVSGTGFVPGATVYYCQATITGQPPTPGDCGETTGSTVADGTGAFTADVTVHRFLVVKDTGVIDCAQPSSHCGIGAADLLAPGGSAVVAPITFTTKPPVTDPLNARINGTVTDRDGNAVAGVRVFGYRATDTWVGTLQTTTDEFGNYVLEDAEPGIAYRVFFVPPAGSGRVSEWYNGPTSDGTPLRSLALDIRLGTSQPVVTASAELAIGGSIKGTVVGRGGTPVANALVWAYGNTDRYVGTYAAFTHPDGTYLIEGAQPGYPLRIHFVPPSASGLAPEWFDDVALRSAAQVVTPLEGSTITANAQLAP